MTLPGGSHSELSTVLARTFEALVEAAPGVERGIQRMKNICEKRGKGLEEIRFGEVIR
jgi:hypothetical protein